SQSPPQATTAIAKISSPSKPSIANSSSIAFSCNSTSSETVTTTTTDCISKPISNIAVAPVCLPRSVLAAADQFSAALQAESTACEAVLKDLLAAYIGMRKASSKQQLEGKEIGEADGRISEMQSTHTSDIFVLQRRLTEMEHFLVSIDRISSESCEEVSLYSLILLFFYFCDLILHILCCCLLEKNHEKLSSDILSSREALNSSIELAERFRRILHDIFSRLPSHMAPQGGLRLHTRSAVDSCFDIPASLCSGLANMRLRDFSYLVLDSECTKEAKEKSVKPSALSPGHQSYLHSWLSPALDRLLSAIVTKSDKAEDQLRELSDRLSMMTADLERAEITLNMDLMVRPTHLSQALVRQKHQNKSPSEKCSDNLQSIFKLLQHHAFLLERDELLVSKLVERLGKLGFNLSKESPSENLEAKLHSDHTVSQKPIINQDRGPGDDSVAKATVGDMSSKPSANGLDETNKTPENRKNGCLNHLSRLSTPASTKTIDSPHHIDPRLDAHHQRDLAIFRWLERVLDKQKSPVRDEVGKFDAGETDIRFIRVPEPPVSVVTICAQNASEMDQSTVENDSPTRNVTNISTISASRASPSSPSVTSKKLETPNINGE
ncbi:unnamed protein product, partial [Protopolystoma xenopodis]